eukprot:tig00020629_g12351.t1
MLRTFEAKNFQQVTNFVSLMVGNKGSLSCTQTLEGGIACAFVRTLWTDAIKSAFCAKAVDGGVRPLWAGALVCGLIQFFGVTLGLWGINRIRPPTEVKIHYKQRDENVIVDAEAPPEHYFTGVATPEQSPEGAKRWW